ncbi:MAG: uroporphyrinogen-III synthase [Alphaproteobacteria bacterium]|nr:uroporphyrinogen-III synthase [Alphaproteobacteria bacterium]
MHLWLTRPIEDAGRLRAQLVGQGHEVTMEPLLRIEYFRDEPIDFEDAQALIATSKNALRALAGRPEEAALKEIPLFVVGRGTAQAAEAMGFETVIEGPSNASALMGLIINACSINDGALIHLSAANVAYNLCEELRHLGYHVFQPILYRAVQATNLSDVLLRNIKIGRIEGVILLSGRTAEAYASIVNTPELLGPIRKLTHFCLSTAVSARLSTLQPINVKLSSRPNIDEMLALTAL